MHWLLRRRPSPAMAVALLALFIALGGSASALMIADVQIADNAVTSADIRASTSGTTLAATSRPEFRSAEAAATPAAFSMVDNRQIPLPDSLRRIAHLQVPTGKYVINAKLQVSNASRGELPNLVCELIAGDRSDRRDGLTLAPPGVNFDSESVPLQVVASFSRRRDVELRCSDFGQGIGFARHTKITAIRVGSLRVSPR